VSARCPGATVAGVTERLELSQGAWLMYLPRFLAQAEADALHRELEETTPWDSNVEGMFGRPRRTYWVGEFAYAYSGVVHHPAPWTASLETLRRAVEEQAYGESRGQYRGVLMNLYRGGEDSIGFHADNEATIAPESPIASVSLGAERTFVLAAKKKRLGVERRMRLAHGSLLVMCGRTQKDWRHGIPAEPEVEGTRVNLTFREYVDAVVGA
jgi:alkylated DNA repair dioxygenase AlkB